MILTNLGRAHHFNYERPSFNPPCVNIATHGGAERVLENQEHYKPMWSEGFSSLLGTGETRFSIRGDSSSRDSQTERIKDQLYNEGWYPHVKAFYAQHTDRLIAEKSYRLAGQNFVDIIRDVGNLAPVHFVSRLFNLPLRTTESGKGVYSEQELYMVLATIFASTCVDAEPAKSFPLRQAARAVGSQLGRLAEAHVKCVTGFGIGGLFGSRAHKNDPVAAYGNGLIKGLSKAGLSNHDIAWNQILPTAGASVPNLAEVVCGI